MESDSVTDAHKASLPFISFLDSKLKQYDTLFEQLSKENSFLRSKVEELQKAFSNQQETIDILTTKLQKLGGRPNPTLPNTPLLSDVGERLAQVDPSTLPLVSLENYMKVEIRFNPSTFEPQPNLPVRTGEKKGLFVVRWAEKETKITKLIFPRGFRTSDEIKNVLASTVQGIPKDYYLVDSKSKEVVTQVVIGDDVEIVPVDGVIQIKVTYGPTHHLLKMVAISQRLELLLSSFGIQNNRFVFMDDPVVVTLEEMDPKMAQKINFSFYIPDTAHIMSFEFNGISKRISMLKQSPLYYLQKKMVSMQLNPDFGCWDTGKDLSHVTFSTLLSSIFQSNHNVMAIKTSYQEYRTELSETVTIILPTGKECKVALSDNLIKYFSTRTMFWEKESSNKIQMESSDMAEGTFKDLLSYLEISNVPDIVIFTEEINSNSTLTPKTEVPEIYDTTIVVYVNNEKKNLYLTDTFQSLDLESTLMNVAVGGQCFQLSELDVNFYDLLHQMEVPIVEGLEIVVITQVESQ